MARVVLAAFWAAAMVLVGWFMIHGDGRMSAQGLEARLQRAAETALFEAGLDEWARVRVSGQRATVTGQAPREEERAAARAAIRRAAGPGGVALGGVTRVRDATTLAEAMSPYVWRASRSASGVMVSGGAPSRAARRELAEDARQLFPNGLVDRMRVARGAPDDMAWAAAARAGLAQLAQMTEGQVVMTDLAIEVTGRVPDQAARERVADAASRAPAVFTTYVSVEALDGSEARAAPVAAAGPPILRSRAACQAALNAAAAAGVIRFGGDGAALDKESYPTLDGVAAVAKRCRGLAVAVLGAPRAGAAVDAADSAAPDARDVNALDASPRDAGAVTPELARARAQAVADYLVLKGVAPDQSFADVLLETVDDEPDLEGGERASPVVFQVRD